MIKLCLAGGLGRMGRMIASLAQEETDIKILSVWEGAAVVSQVSDYAAATGYSKNPVTVTTEGARAVERSDVVIDFATSAVFDEIVKACDDFSKPLVTGTTAIPDKEARLKSLATKVAVVSSPNMAVGVNVLFGVCEMLGSVMGASSDIEIVESHHRTKKDVPSGTALEIGRILGDVTGKEVVVGRPAGSAERGGEIVIHSLRVGDVAGKHTVGFSPEGETLEITHTARSRACFAAGALRAARFAAASSPGLFSMRDVLNLK
jgi:4-hydroxy-tetrahydrodipicolinate reductase